MLKFSKKWVKLQGHKVKNNGTHGKVLSQGMFMWNIKALALIVQKLLARLKFQRGGQNDRQDKNNMPPDLQSQGHKKKTSHLGSKMKSERGNCSKKKYKIDWTHTLGKITKHIAEKDIRKKKKYNIYGMQMLCLHPSHLACLMMNNS